jgi:hypothetical protein
MATYEVDVGGGNYAEMGLMGSRSLMQLRISRANLQRQRQNNNRCNAGRRGVAYDHRRYQVPSKRLSQSKWVRGYRGAQTLTKH